MYLSHYILGILKVAGSYYGKLSHVVAVVGYDTSESGEPYWIVKNSWGTNSGNNGYLWISRERGFDCGITRELIYPVIEVNTNITPIKGPQFTERSERRADREQVPMPVSDIDSIETLSRQILNNFIRLIIKLRMMG